MTANDMTANDVTTSEVTVRGGQPGNANAMRHGLRSTRVRLVIGTLPKSMHRIERNVIAFRRLIEAAVLDARGEIAVMDAALIQSACRHETHAQLAQRWLRLHADTLDAGQRLAYSKAVADASTARDKCLERLKLTHDAADAYAALFAPETHAAGTDQDDGSDDDDAAAGHVANDNGTQD